MTHRQFQRRCRALGCPNFHAAAHRLQLPPSSVYRLWTGQRKVSARVQERLEVVEREQPVKPLTRDMERVLLAANELDGVTTPAPRSNFELGIAWMETIHAMIAGGMLRGRAGLVEMTPLGARTAAWLRERGDARMET